MLPFVFPLVTGREAMAPALLGSCPDISPTHVAILLGLQGYLRHVLTR